VSKM